MDLNLKNNNSYWLITDDIGYYNENGLIYLYQKIIDHNIDVNSAIKRSNIENTLLKHPLITEACVWEIKDKCYAAMLSLKYSNVNHLAPESSKQMINYIKG